MFSHTACTSLFFFFNDTATTEIYTLSLHDALPICPSETVRLCGGSLVRPNKKTGRAGVHRACGHGKLRRDDGTGARSEEHTSELQSQSNLVCRLLLEKKKKMRMSIL